MKHASGIPGQHALGQVPPAVVEVLPLQARNPGTEFLRRELEENRKSERWLILYGTISLILVGILITFRLVFFT
jgi:hypothetical protein